MTTREKLGARYQKAVDFFEQRIVPMMDDRGCWEWMGGQTARGWAQMAIWVDGVVRTVRASRFAYELFKGDIPEGKIVCHTCDNRMCVNPAHLYAGTHTDNNRDTVRRGRHRWAVARRQALGAA